MSAIDLALENNQLRAIKIIFDYIINYQNSYVYSFLFEDNLIDIMDKGIDCSSLINSDIFCHRIDFPEWPMLHLNKKYQIAPFNNSIFKLRFSYGEIFP